MTPERDTDSETALSLSSSSPQKATQVLCKEVGASHPDGALRQIRTMKRLLRSHYRVKQRLERYGVESLSDAVTHIADLSRQVRQLKEKERERALDRVELLDDLMDAVDSMQNRLQARPSDAAPSSSSSTAPDDAPFETARQLIDALEQALDEIRLELWLHQSSDEEGPNTPVASTAADLLDRLADEVDAAAESYDALASKNKRLTAEKEALEQDVTQLQQTVKQKEERIRQLEQQQSATS